MIKYLLLDTLVKLISKKIIVNYVLEIDNKYKLKLFSTFFQFVYQQP